jgi:tetratricopeptide (TPR) repeat protein
MLQKDWSTAALKFSSALSVQREARRILEATTRDASPDIPSLIEDENIADTMKRLGKAYTALKEYDKAENILLEALTIFQDACMAFKATSTQASPLILASKQDSIANILFCLAEVKEASQQHHEAIQLYDESLTLRLYSDEARPTGEKLNNLPIAMCLAGIGNARMSRGEYCMAYRAFTEAIQSAKKDSLPGHHPIIQTLNDKSRAAATVMVQQEECGATVQQEEYGATAAGMADQEKSDQTENNPKLKSAGISKSRNSHPIVLEAIESSSNNEISDDDGENRQVDFESLNEEGTGTKRCAPNFSTWFDPVAKLEKNVKAKRKRGDIPGALRIQDRIVDFRRVHLLKKQQEMKPRSKETRDLAKSLVHLARLQSFMGATKLAEGSFREAMTLFKSSGVPTSADCMLEIEAELGRMGSKNGVVWSERTPLNSMRIDKEHRPIRTQQSTTFIPM